MKKSYIMPTIMVVNVQATNLMEASQMSVGEKMSTGSADSRRGAAWDDEE